MQIQLFQFSWCYFSCIVAYNLIVMYQKGMNLTIGKKQVCHSSLFEDTLTNEGGNLGQINSSLKKRMQTLVLWK